MSPCHVVPNKIHRSRHLHVYQRRLRFKTLLLSSVQIHAQARDGPSRFKMSSATKQHTLTALKVKNLGLNPPFLGEAFRFFVPLCHGQRECTAAIGGSDGIWLEGRTTSEGRTINSPDGDGLGRQVVASLHEDGLLLRSAGTMPINKSVQCAFRQKEYIRDVQYLLKTTAPCRAWTPKSVLAVGDVLSPNPVPFAMVPGGDLLQGYRDGQIHLHTQPGGSFHSQDEGKFRLECEAPGHLL